MTVYANQLISGSGQVDFGGGVRINYVLVKFNLLPYGARILEIGNPDHALRMGFIALGNDTDVITESEQTFWTAPKWMDFTNFQWHPEPTTDASANDFAVWASRIRWYIAPGGEAWLYVFGV